MSDYQRGFADGHKCCEHEKEQLREENRRLRLAQTFHETNAGELITTNEKLKKECTRMKAVVDAARYCTENWCHYDCPCKICKALNALDETGKGSAG